MTGVVMSSVVIGWLRCSMFMRVIVFFMNVPTGMGIVRMRVFALQQPNGPSQSDAQQQGDR